MRSFVGLNLRQSDLPPAALSADRAAVLEHGLQLLVERGGILHAALLAPDGTVVAADADTTADHRATLTPEISEVIAKQATGAAIVGPNASGALAPLATSSVLREYLPIIQSGRVDAVVGIWRDAAPILAQLDAGRVHVVVITLSAALISTLLLIFIFWAAQQRLSRQSRLLVEAARRDPLTGVLNHGALVEILAAAVERARLSHEQIGVALLDLDNFGLLNSTYGHQAGDFVLNEVTRLLEADVPAA